MKPLSWLVRSSAVAVVVSLGASAQAHEPAPRGCAILSPVDSPDAPGFNSANDDIDKKGGFLPYYATLVPVSVRWGYKELVHYYPSYWRGSKHGWDRCGHPGAGPNIIVHPACHDGPALPVGHQTSEMHAGAARQGDSRVKLCGGEKTPENPANDKGTGKGSQLPSPRTLPEADDSDSKIDAKEKDADRNADESKGQSAPRNAIPGHGYGVFTGDAGNDDAVFWRMGGNGLVSYGSPPAPRLRLDIIDMIEGRRRHGCR